MLIEFQDKYKDIFKNSNSENKYHTSFLATEKESDNLVFLKVYDKHIIEEGPKDFLLRQIEREEKLTKLCESENIIKLNRKFESNKYIIFEYEKCDSNLSEYIFEEGELMKKPNVFIEIVNTLSQALKILKEKRVIHRDIKPNNIFIKKKDNINDNNIEENLIIKLGDFGSSIEIEENDSLQIGTLLYSSPEILKKKKYNEKTDLWSLGITLYYLYFGFTPYGNEYNLDLIKSKIYSNNFIFKFTGFPILDILFKKLLTIDPEKRMGHEEFYKYITNENFKHIFEKDAILPEIILNEEKKTYEKIYEEIKNIKNNEEYKKLMNIVEAEITNENLLNEVDIRKRRIIKLSKILKQPHILDIYFSLEDDKKCINILYYNEEPKHQVSINKEIKAFEKSTSGAFIFCNNLDSFKLIMKEISYQISFDKRRKFYLIVTGRACDKIMSFLIKEKFEKCFQYICIFCHKIDKYKYLKDKYKKYNIVDIFKETRDVINKFLNIYNEKEIRPFKMTKLITFEDYKEKYFDRHIKISDFYGDLTVESYKKNLEEINKLINEDNKNNNLIKEKKIVLESFQTFNIDEDLDNLNKKIIKEYSSHTFFGDLNRWLRELNKNTFEEVAYFTSRLMYSLNQYGKDESKYYKEDGQILYRGIELDYSSLLEYERAKDKIILFTAFTSMSESEKVAKNIFGFFEVEEKEKFSVIFYVTNLYKNNSWIPTGINIQEIAKLQSEKEIIYQPFSFYYVKDAKINIKEKIAEIYLETVGKKEIFEEIIKDRKHKVKYNKKENIIELLLK